MFKMKLPRRNFLHLAAGAAVLSAVARIARAHLNGEAAQAAGKQLGTASITADVSHLTSVTSAVRKTLGLVPPL
jgi:hypothetical protein